MISDIQGRVNQLSPSTFSAGDQEKLQLSNTGELWTAGWRERLIAAGVVYQVSMGAVSATAHTSVAGNAAVDLDQPEVIIGVDTGVLIPLEIDIAIHTNDDDAYDDVTEIGFYADRTQATAAGATATDETPVNLLDGGDAFSGRAYSIVTADVTDPDTGADWLGGRFWIKTQMVAETGGGFAMPKNWRKSFTLPNLLRGPCQIVGYVTGTNSPTFMGSVTFAHCPAGWFPIA